MHRFTAETIVVALQSVTYSLNTPHQPATFPATDVVRETYLVSTWTGETCI